MKDIKLSRVISSLIFVVVLVVIISSLNNLFYSDINFVNHRYMHSSLEAIGATVLIVLAFVIISNQSVFDIDVRYMVYGYIFMGVFSVFHSMLDDGDGFVFLFTIATLTGAVGFIVTIILCEKKIRQDGDFRQTFIILFLAIIIGLVLIEFSFYPEMIIGDSFTILADLINFIAGILYTISIFYFLKYRKHYSSSLYLPFIISNVLLAISCYTFSFSSAWTFLWWFWHYIRLAGFSILFTFILYVSERNKKEIINKSNKITYMSFHDELTTLYNRRFFNEELKRYDNPRNYPLTIVMADLNGLKLINDAFGHQIGDEYICEAARIFKQSTRGNDVLARWGGDEFTIILPNAPAKAAKALISRIQNTINASSYKYGDISVAFGYSSKTDKTQDIKNVFKDAEEMMYYNKNQVVSSVRSATINTILQTLFEKSSEIQDHSNRVSKIAVAIAIEMKLPQSKVNDIETIGKIHDIGKIIIDTSILNKPSKLNHEEWSIMRQHPLTGSKMLSTTQEYTRLAPGVLHHHERIDGKGYPSGIKGDEIPIESKIICVADAFDAMVSKRPYKSTPKTIQEAKKEILKCAGTQFDQEVAEVFVHKVSDTNFI